MELREILSRLGISTPSAIMPFHDPEDGSEYDVWKVSADGSEYVLKKAKENEISVYRGFFRNAVQGVPHFYGSVSFQGEEYFLMEYVEGGDLCRCDRGKLTAALDTLIHLQDMYWDSRDLRDTGYRFEESLRGREDRGKYLGDAELEEAYAVFLRLYSELPRTLCHDDLLPFNVLIRGGKAVIIDWEQAGILPYPVSLARLIAHGTDEKDALFHMTEEDKEFAIAYYYEHLIKGKGIGHDDYRRAVDYFLLYEYCEWIMLGIKYEDADMARYREYLARAKEHIRRMNCRHEEGISLEILA